MEDRSTPPINLSSLQNVQLEDSEQSFMPMPHSVQNKSEDLTVEATQQTYANESLMTTETSESFQSLDSSDMDGNELLLSKHMY